jgi:hypothetical protein
MISARTEPPGTKADELYYSTDPALCRILEERPELRETLRIVLKNLIPQLTETTN